MLEPRRPLVMVLGMHRSGTSLCANFLTELGVDMAEAAGPSPANTRGHWERSRINDLHDELFALYGMRWTDASHILGLPEGWQHGHGVERIGGALVEYLAPILQRAACAGFKDPRTARLMPLWDVVLERLHAEPRFIFCVRDPAQVARSLEARDRTGLAEAEYRWLIYNAHGVHGIGARPVCVVAYNDWFAEPLRTAERLAAWACPECAYSSASLQGLVAAVVDPDLRHDPPERLAATSAARSLCDMIVAGASADTLSPALLSVAAQFLGFEQTIRPLLRETVTLRASVADQNRVIRDLQGAIGALRADRQGQ
jgi:hypothetical protein